MSEFRTLKGLRLDQYLGFIENTSKGGQPHLREFAQLGVGTARAPGRLGWIPCP
jgi:hypothetical protein